MLCTDCDITEAKYCIRYLTEDGDSLECLSFNPSYNWGESYFTDLRNGLLTLFGRNNIPQVMPLKLDTLTFRGCHYLITSNVEVGNESVNDEQEQAGVTFKDGSNTILEYEGNVIFKKGVVIEKGAVLNVVPSDIKH